MKFAYADPPYLGCGQKHYGHQHERAADWDRIETHALLIEQLRNECDAWGLSCSVPTLEEMLHLARRIVGPNEVRVGGWFKPFASFKPGVNPGYCWEPVIFTGERSAKDRGGKSVDTVRDWIRAPAIGANITLKRGTSGARVSA